MTKKTRAELEKDRNEWKHIAFLYVIILLFFVVAMAIFALKLKNLQEENQALQIELRKANWNNDTLLIHYKCGDFEDIKFTKAQEGFWTFNDHGDFMNAKSVLQGLGCEVTE